MLKITKEQVEKMIEEYEKERNEIVESQGLLQKEMNFLEDKEEALERSIESLRDLLEFLE